MTPPCVRRLIALLAAFVVVGALAAAGSAAPKALGTVPPGKSVAFDPESVWVMNANGSALFGVEDCFGKVATPGTDVVLFDAHAAVLAVVPARGASPRVLETFPDGAAVPALPDFQNLPKPDQLLPIIDGPAQQLQLQIPLDGGSAVQFAGFKPPFFGFSDPFAGGLVVGSDGNPLQNGFEVALSPTRIEVELLVPGAQPQQFAQPFSFVCSKVMRAVSLLAKTRSDLNAVGNVPPSVRNALVWKAFRNRLHAEEQIVDEATTDIKADEYLPAFKLGDSLKKAQKNLDVAMAKVLPQIRSAGGHQAFVKARTREDADAAVGLAAVRQMITLAG